MSKIRIVTHNVWNRDTNNAQWEGRGIDCSADARAPLHVRVYRDLLPDIIGTQEMTNLMMKRLILGLQKEKMKYTAVFGNFTGIIYRTDRFELSDNDYVLFPKEYKEYEGTFNDSDSKSCLICVFKDKENGKKLVVADCHLWWKSADRDSNSYQCGSDEVRALQIELAISKVTEMQKKYGCPAFLLGDLNDVYSSKALKKAFELGYVHTHDIAKDFATNTSGYHYCFCDGYKGYEEGKSFYTSIDHILVNNLNSGIVERYDYYAPDWYLPASDHVATYIDVIL